MEISSDAHNHVEPGPSSVMPVNQVAPLKIRWGRTSFAAVGLLALLTAVVSGALSVFGLGSPALAWTGLIVFGAVIAGLRAVAVRDQNNRIAAHELARTTAEAAAVASAPAAVERKETALFDGAEGAQKTPVVRKALTAEELRTAALRVAAKGAADAKLAHTQSFGEGELVAETWDPVEVPKPGYVTARKAASDAAPLEIPDVPKSAGTSIKADQAGVGVGSSTPVLVEGGVVDGAAPVAKPVAPATGTALGSAKTHYALNNLDDVLQRRRA